MLICAHHPSRSAKCINNSGLKAATAHSIMAADPALNGATGIRYANYTGTLLSLEHIFPEV